MDTILVPLDGSPLSERALPLAAALAHELGLSLCLLHVREENRAFDSEQDIQAAFQAAKWHVRELYGFEPETTTRKGYAARVIVEEAGRPGVWAVVMASHSREALLRIVLGSIAEQFIDLSPVPVFLVPASVPAPGLPRFKRILVPLDGSQQAEAILTPVNSLGASLGAEVVPLHVELGDPSTEIVAACEREHADLVAFATFGRTPLEQDQLSRVAQAVLRHSQAPIMAFGREALRRLSERTETLSGPAR